MINHNPCPSSQDIEAMLLGRSSVSNTLQLETHLETCKKCQQKLDNLAVDIPLTSFLKKCQSVSQDATEPKQDLSSLMLRLEDMARQFTPPGFDIVSPTDGGSNFGNIPNGPDRVGVYRVIRLLGAGGMGLVYLAEDEVLCRNVAVKILRPRMARKQQARDSFLREARAVAALKHDNVVTVFHVGEAPVPSGEPLPFLAMELLEGDNLANWLRREGPVRSEWAIRIGRQAAEGIAAAHARGVVHRDIKPGNLWLESPPGWQELPSIQQLPLPAVARVKVLDFGLALLAGQNGPGGSREVFGTPDYMAPELAAGLEVDHRSDLYSFGVVLYELVTGHRPFQQDASRKQFIYQPPVPVRTLQPNVPPELADLIHRLLSPLPEDRPASVRHVIQVLVDLETPSASNTIPNSSELTVVIPIRRHPRKRLKMTLLATAVIAPFVLFAALWLNGKGTSKEFANVSEEVLPDPINWKGPVDENWCQAVAKLPVYRQPDVVLAKLRELNPGFDGVVDRITFDKNAVIEFGFLTDHVKDISPLRALPSLEMLTIVGSLPGKGKLLDLSPIRELQLTTLNIWQNPNLSDLSPIKGMPMKFCQAGDTAIEDLTPLTNMPLTLLSLNNCRVRDLSTVVTLEKLSLLRCDGCPIQTLKTLANSQVKDLIADLDCVKRDFATLDQLPKLTRVNNMSKNDFRTAHILSR